MCDAVKIVKALYDFTPLQSDDLAFRKGDKMKIIQSEDTSVYWPIITSSRLLHFA